MKGRLQKVLASRGIASRRACEGLIAAGEVTVNGQVATLGLQVDPEHDDIRVRGLSLAGAIEPRYLALNKPLGLVTSTVSTHGEQTVMSLLAKGGSVRPVGRLDKDTAGLLFLSTDGAWANLVTHPRYGIEKEYQVTVAGRPTPGTLRQLRTGVVLPDDTRTAPAQVDVIAQRASWADLQIVLHEGKKRQIRVMCAVVGHPVRTLTRVRIGAVRLGTLPVGAYRELSEDEVECIREDARRGFATEGAAGRHSDRH
ncbi:MAG: rRNA pseudouridine synthase [Chloroflexota bacterium]|nr:rRNA pseudouridine synthase [Chloroflexota bacterium]